MSEVLDVQYALACRRVHYERPCETLRQAKAYRTSFKSNGSLRACNRGASAIAGSD